MLFSRAMHFNSRPHEEVDKITNLQASSITVFQLTTSRGGRRSKRCAESERSGISTHDLTRRSTREFAKKLADNIFQLTTSRGGRLRFCGFPLKASCISTHDLTRRSTQCSPLPQVRNFYFNSRPHEEVDGSSPLARG